MQIIFISLQIIFISIMQSISKLTNTSREEKVMAVFDIIMTKNKDKFLLAAVSFYITTTSLANTGTSIAL